ASGSRGRHRSRCSAGSRAGPNAVTPGLRRHSGFQTPLAPGALPGRGGSIPARAGCSARLAARCSIVDRPGPGGLAPCRGAATGSAGGDEAIIAAAKQAIALAERANAASFLVRANYIRMEVSLDAGDLAAR